MKTIAEILAHEGITLDQAGTAVAACFGGSSGTIVRGLLAAISPPLNAPVGDTPEETYRAIGRAEVVFFLLSLSEPEATLGTIINKIYGKS
jgi:hypothetical protein